MIELVPDSYVARLDLEKIFGRTAPLHVDLGCGDGTFLCALAQRMPEKNFLGVERMAGRVRTASRKAGPSRTGGKIDNVRILHLETSYAVRHLLPPGAVEVFYLLFPDPWPKRRHQRRRVVTREFLSAIADALANHGTLHIATDQLDYFEQISQLADQSRDFEKLEPNGSIDFPCTTFEKKFQTTGAAIYRLELRKVSPVT